MGNAFHSYGESTQKHKTTPFKQYKTTNFDEMYFAKCQDYMMKLLMLRIQNFVRILPQIQRGFPVDVVRNTNLLI